MFRILFLVHIEDPFRKYFPSNYISKITGYIRRNSCEQVIHFTSHVNSDSPINELKPFITSEIDWGWGYEPACFANHESKERKWIIDATKYSAHEYTWIPPELRKWKKEVILGGGFDGECLGDMEAILNNRNISYKKLPSLVYKG